MRIELVTTESGLSGLRPEWNRLLQRSASDSVFLTWEWLWSWWAAYQQRKQLFLLVARDSAGDCLGIAPLYREPFRFGRRLRFLGDGTFDSDYLDFIAAREKASIVTTAFFDYLASVKNQWDALQLNEIPENSPNLVVFRSYAEEAGWHLDPASVLCGFANLPATWEEYLRTLRPRFRTSVRSCLRNLEEWSGQIEHLTDPQDASSWLRGLFALHSDRWATRNQSGVFATENKRSFYREMSNAFLERGFLHVTRWRVKGRVLACQFGFLYQGTYHLLQEGFDAGCSHVSPGITLRAATIRELIGRGIKAYDFLGGLGRHKTDWGAEEKRSWRIAAAPPGLRGYSYVRLPIIVRSAKQQAKRALPNKLLSRWRSRRTDQSSKQPHAAEGGAVVGKGRSWKQPLASALYRSGALRLLQHFSEGRELRPGPRGMMGLHRTSVPKFVVLCYHRVGSGGVPLYSELDPKAFEAQMRFLRDRYRLVSVNAMCRELDDARSTEHSVAVTFDDGYRDLYTHAFPVLQKYDIPATVYLTVGAVESDDIAWYDRVFLGLKVRPEQKLDLLLERPQRFLLSTDHARLEAAEAIIAFLRTLPDSERRAFCTLLEEGLQMPAEQTTGRMLDWHQIKVMQNAGISFGSHTLTHPALSRLDPASLDWELLESKRKLEARLGRTVEHFAYPFGKPADCGDASAAVARCGYRSAVTTVWGVNVPGQSAYELRRVSIGDEPQLSTFALKLAQLFLTGAEEPAGTSKKPIGDENTVSVAG